MADRTDQALTEYSSGFEGLLLAQDMEHGPRQLVGDRFDGNDRIRLGGFAIVIPLRFGIVATTGQKAQIIRDNSRRGPHLPPISHVVFKGNSAGNYEIYAYDTRASLLYQVTSTSTDETLADVKVSGGVATVVYTSFHGADNDAHARSFNLNRPSGVAEQLAELRGLVLGSGSGNHLMNALDAKLKAAENALAAGDTAAACDSVQAFINQVRAQRGKKIAPADADAWILRAQELRNGLNCPWQPHSVTRR